MRYIVQYIEEANTYAVFDTHVADGEDWLAYGSSYMSKDKAQSIADRFNREHFLEVFNENTEKLLKLK